MTLDSIRNSCDVFLEKRGSPERHGGEEEGEEKEGLVLEYSSSWIGCKLQYF